MGSIKNLFINANTRLFLACLFVMTFLFLMNRWNYNRFQEAEKKAESAMVNLAAAQDTIRVTKAKNNQLEYDKLAYVVKSKKELKALSDSLAKQVEITKGNVAVIQSVGVQVVHDTVPVTTTVYIEDSVIALRSHIDTTFNPGNYRKLSFESVYDAKSGRAHSIILGDTMGFTATVGLKVNDKKQYEIFVRPHYPNMKVGMLEGAVIEDNLIKEKVKIPLITIGGHIGWMPVAYEANTKKLDLNLNRFGVSVGLNFNLAAMLRK